MLSSLKHGMLVEGLEAAMEKRSDERSYSETTREIRVSVQPQPIAEESDPDGNIFAFAYHVTIENLGSQQVQLIERHWVILSADTQVAEVVGPGVVGLQPVLLPGESFRYSSSAVIHDPFGAMHGTYTFRGSGSEYFQVAIPRFDLLYPFIVH